MTTAPNPTELSRPTPKRRHRSPVTRLISKVRRALPWRLVLVIVLTLITLPTVALVILAADSVARVQESVTSLKRVMNTLTDVSLTDLRMTDLDRLQSAVSNLSDSLRRARQQTALISHLAFINADYEASYAALNAAQPVADAAQEILNGLQPTLFLLLNNPDGTALPSGERLIELLQVGQSRFNQSKISLTDAKSKLDALKLGSVSPGLLLQIRELIQDQTLLAQLNDLLIQSPDLLKATFGMDAGRNYLILSENSDELRPSGGYISTWGWLRVRRFRIADYGYNPTTDLTPNPPPAEMASQLNIPDWWFHFKRPIYSAFDSSWYADFPNTARMAAWFYNNGNNPRSPLDGVISIDIYGFEQLLSGLGSVTVPGYDETLTPANFRQVIYRIRGQGGDDTPYKQFLAAAYKQILSDWQNSTQADGGKLLGVLLHALQEKHIMITFTDEKLNASLDMLGWSGRQTPGAYDYLMVADANMGNKSNRSVIRETTYDVAIQPDGSVKSRAAFKYDYPASIANSDPAVQPAQYRDQKDYDNLMQVYVPKASTLDSTDNLQNPLTQTTQGDMGLYVTQTHVDFDGSQRFQFSYHVPAIVESFGAYRRYRLLLQKQPGTNADAANVQVMLPAGASLISVSPTPAANYALDVPVLEFRLQLLTDRWVEIVYKP